MVTRNAFQAIYGSRDKIKRYLLEGGYVYNMKFLDHKWKFINGGMGTILLLVDTKCHHKFASAETYYFFTLF